MYGKLVENKAKLKNSWHMILLIMNTTYPVEFCLAVSRLDVILGSNKAKVTIHDIKTKTDEKNKVITEWNKCHPSQQTISGNVPKTCFPELLLSQFTTYSKVYIIGKNSTVTNKGTIFANKTKGHVNLNFFFEKE